MKLASYEHRSRAAFGLVDGEMIAPLAGAGGVGPASLGEALGMSQSWWQKQVESAHFTLAIGEVRLLPVIPDPAKIICVGLNYRTHQEEAGAAPVGFPTLFTRFSDTQIAAGAPAMKPPVSDAFDYEGEVAVVMGRPCRQVARQDALSYVAGYSCYNDFSVRDWQRHSSQWTAGKNFPSTGAFGPWLVTADEIADPGDMRLTTTVNGEKRQDAFVRDMIFPIPDLIAYITTFTSLAPGDVIVTGTPGGAGAFLDPPSYLGTGDDVEVEVSGVGTLRTAVA